ncbi:polysaccharide biosynthesis/export family protein [Formicincola oecophyllae]|nr:polysaccharide biosynthesis/export family protein [Formicincola oecophyllae]
MVRHGARSKQNREGINYKLLAMTPDIADILSAEVPPTLSSLDKTTRRYGQNDHIGPGDVLDITIFELGNGLFSSSDRGVGGGGSGASSTPVATAPPRISTQKLPPTQVEGNGTIMVPYVGTLHVAGMTPIQVAHLIQNHLWGKSQDPQVMVRIANDIGNTVIVSGEVKKPGRVVLSLADERLSDLVAIAGGASYPPSDTEIELVRHGHVGMTDLSTLENRPEEDIRADPGDRLRVIYQPRTYTAFGAVGQSQARNEIKFGTANLTLAGALARVGGPSAQMADPEAVYLLRYEDSIVAHKLGLEPSRYGKGWPVVYELNLLDPEQYFLARQIPMKDHDILLFANAATDRYYQINQLIGTLLGEASMAGLYAVR